jgi:hypothetical protein
LKEPKTLRPVNKTVQISTEGKKLWILPVRRGYMNGQLEVAAVTRYNERFGPEGKPLGIPESRNNSSLTL